MRNADHILEHGTLVAKVWVREYVDEVDDIRVYIRRLRKQARGLLRRALPQYSGQRPSGAVREFTW